MFKTLDDIDANGKRILLRGDLNVPMRDGRVSDATRIERLLPNHHGTGQFRCEGYRPVAFWPTQG